MNIAVLVRRAFEDALSARTVDGLADDIAAPLQELRELFFRRSREIQAGIKRVVYAEDYRSEEGLNLLRRVGIECVQCRLDEK